MNPKKIAESIPEEERGQKTAEYLKKTANNQKEAAKQLEETTKEAKNALDNILKSAKGNDYTKLASIINEVNKLWDDARQGKDINKVVAKIKQLK